MCVVSMIADGYRDRWLPGSPYRPWEWPNGGWYPRPEKEVDLKELEKMLKPKEKDEEEGISREEYEALREELEELKLLIKAAKRFDEKTGQPDCESAEKTEFLKKMGEILDVDMSDVLDEVPHNPV